VGGLDPATWPFWQNNAATSFGSFAANGPNGTADAWITVWNNCTDGDEKPSFTISAQNVWEFGLDSPKVADEFEIAA
jgi:formylglycine-generating enzyme required for sulfatase activity